MSQRSMAAGNSFPLFSTSISRYCGTSRRRNRKPSSSRSLTGTQTSFMFSPACCFNFPKAIPISRTPGPTWQRKARLGLRRPRETSFRTSGSKETEHLLVRADLLIQLQRAIASRRLKQAEAATMLRVTQPRVSDVLRGRIDLFSTDALIDMLARLGVGVRLVVKMSRSKKVA